MNTFLEKTGKGVVIASSQCRKELRDDDRHLYQAWHLIGNVFSKLKQYRAIATRYDKSARSFLGAIHLAASVIWLDCEHTLEPSRKRSYLPVF